MQTPTKIEINDRGSVYNEAINEWYSAWQAVFRPAATAKKIDIAIAGKHTIIQAESGKHIMIVAIIFTVGGDVNITIYDGSQPISGPMDFGGANEPRGMVATFPYSPLQLGAGNRLAFDISSSVQVSGMVCYFYQ